jgi:hypothetical protein
METIRLTTPGEVQHMKDMFRYHPILTWIVSGLIVSYVVMAIYRLNTESFGFSIWYGILAGWLFYLWFIKTRYDIMVDPYRTTCSNHPDKKVTLTLPWQGLRNIGTDEGDDILSTYSDLARWCALNPKHAEHVPEYDLEYFVNNFIIVKLSASRDGYTLLEGSKLSNITMTKLADMNINNQKDNNG